METPLFCNEKGADVDHSCPAEEQCLCDAFGLGDCS